MAIGNLEDALKRAVEKNGYARVFIRHMGWTDAVSLIPYRGDARTVIVNHKGGGTWIVNSDEVLAVELEPRPQDQSSASGE